MTQSRISLTTKTAYLGMFLAMSLILSYIDSTIPVFATLPGVKIGLANLPVVLCLYVFEARYAFGLTILKAAIAALLFGSMFSLLYGMTGAVLSCAVMSAVKKTGFIHIITISVLGAVSHNLGQLIVAIIVVKNTGILFYGVVLLIAGVATGLVIGILSKWTLPTFKRMIYKGEMN